MRDELYTYEDYVKDFELDHPGLGEVPDAHVPGLPHRRRSLRLNLLRNAYMAGPFKPLNGWKNGGNLPGW